MQLRSAESGHIFFVVAPQTAAAILAVIAFGPEPSNSKESNRRGMSDAMGLQAGEM